MSKHIGGETMSCLMCPHEKTCPRFPGPTWPECPARISERRLLEAAKELVRLSNQIKKKEPGEWTIAFVAAEKAIKKAEGNS